MGNPYNALTNHLRTQIKSYDRKVEDEGVFGTRGHMGDRKLTVKKVVVGFAKGYDIACKRKALAILTPHKSIPAVANAIIQKATDSDPKTDWSQEGQLG